MTGHRNLQETILLANLYDEMCYLFAPDVIVDIYMTQLTTYALQKTLEDISVLAMQCKNTAMNINQPLSLDKVIEYYLSFICGEQVVLKVI